MPYNIKLDPEVYFDIQDATDYYNKIDTNLGERFLLVLNNHINYLISNPFYQIRYDNIRCLYTKPFPFLIHFMVDEKTKTVRILAILHTSKDPKNWPGEKP
jgi:toxin ParE1/3/4